MSRASDLRDGIVTELTTDFGGSYSIEAFITPRWTREELASGPRVGVRIGGRELTLGHGADQTDVTIQVGVVGITPDGASATEGYKKLELDAVDAYDALLESIVALWMNRGRLMGKGVAEHYPVSITQAIQFDAQQLERGVYLTLIEITYRDSED